MKIVKEDVAIVILLIVTLIALSLFGIFIYNIIFNNDNNNYIEPAKESNISKDNNAEENKELEDNNAEENKEPENNNAEENKEDIADIIDNAKTSTNTVYEDKLIEIVKIFNDSQFTQNMSLEGYSIRATTNKDRMIIFCNGKGINTYVEFNLNNNILSTNIKYYEVENMSSTEELQNLVENMFATSKMLYAIIIMDCFAQLNGYPSNKLYNVFSNNDESLNYTLEKEGVELKKVEENKTIVISIDLDSNCSFLSK